MFFTNSIRWRLQIWHGLILLAVLGGFGFTAWRLQHERTLTIATERLLDRYNQTVRLLRQSGPPDGGRPRPGPGGFEDDGPPPRPGPPPRREDFDAPPPAADPAPDLGPNNPNPGPNPSGPPPGRPLRPRSGPSFYGFEAALKADEIPNGTVTVWRRDGSLLATTHPGPLPSFPQNVAVSPQIIRTGNQLLLLAATPPGEVIRISRDLTSDLLPLRRTAWQLAAAAAGILALGLAGGWWAAGRSLRPLATISSTAARLSAGNLAERLRVEDPNDELGQLAGVLNAMLGRLDTSFTQQTRFISDAAHELRTPVTVMLTQTQTALRRERPAAEYRQSLEACQRAANRMRQLIESLLALARLDSGDQPMKRLRFDLSRAAAEQVELLTPLAAERNVTFHQDLTPLPMEGDPDYLTLTLANLLTNAIHYNREGGTIHLIIRKENNEAILTVTDTGEGMSPAALARIFDRFYRADQSRSLPAGRTGLGLAITKSIIDAHRGTITVESTPGTGTTFTVRLPLTAVTAPTPTPAAGSEVA
ncbi:MAG: hypothetical protein JWL81_2209 [Verrucomicrobiales bacterium]|nr:hypothetical protein [Verrucomicrobiales bacterium]